ncbi:MAG TPA: hypothetical protein VF170_05780, partial [Planctomycetaceae bacterium]
MRLAGRIVLLLAALGSTAEAAGQAVGLGDASRSEAVRLLTSPATEDRREGLARAAGLTPDEELRALVAAVADSDTDAVAQGHARLLLADWDAADRTVVRPLGDSPGDVARWDTDAPWVPPAPALPGKSSGDPFEELFDFDSRDGEELSLFPEPRNGDEPRPDFLDRPLDPPAPEVPPVVPRDDLLYVLPVDATTGFAGPSGVLPTETQTNSHFAPVEDRWRVGLPPWDRYGKGHPPVDDYPYTPGMLWDPYNQNVLKGDYPILGQHTFLRVTGEALLINEFRQLPTPTTPFESTARPGTYPFFGDPDQFLTTNFFLLRTELVHGNAGFKPDDWLIRVTPAFNANYLDVNELGIVSPDVRR